MYDMLELVYFFSLSIGRKVGIQYPTNQCLEERLLLGDIV